MNPNLCLESTPHIKIRKANGLYNIDYTAADIIPGNSIGSNHDAAARSYNTIIGVYTRTSTGEKIYLNTAGVYSTTTAAKHKPRAARIADYNGYRIFNDIKPEILHDIFFYNKYDVDAILKETVTRNKILEALQDNKPDANAILDAKYTGIIKARKAPESTPYKNGNLLVKYYYETNFKYCSNIYYELNVKHIKITRPAFNGKTGPRPPATGNKIIQQIVNINY